MDFSSSPSCSQNSVLPRFLPGTGQSPDHDTVEWAPALLEPHRLCVHTQYRGLAPHLLPLCWLEAILGGPTLEFPRSWVVSLKHDYGVLSLSLSTLRCLSASGVPIRGALPLLVVPPYWLAVCSFISKSGCVSLHAELGFVLQNVLMCNLLEPDQKQLFMCQTSEDFLKLFPWVSGVIFRN